VLKEPIIAWKLKRKLDHQERKSTRYSVSHIDLSKSSKRSMIRMPKRWKTSRNSQRLLINAWIFGASTNKSQKSLSQKQSVTSSFE
jgi:uncharacterized protein YfaP (DUF2135 family)